MIAHSKAKRAAVRAGGVLAGSFALTAAFPALAFAAEEEASGGISAILPDPVEFVPMLIAFLILLAILAKFGWPLFAGMLDKRENAIKDSLEKAESARVESERALAEYKAQLEDAKAQAAQIVADAKQTGEAVKADITAKAQAEAEQMIAKARVAIEAEKQAAVADLQASVADTSIAVASRLIGQDLSDDEHRAIIARYVNEAGSFNAK